MLPLMPGQIILREMVLVAQKLIDECLVRESEVCSEQLEWVKILGGDGVGFEEREWEGSWRRSREE